MVRTPDLLPTLLDLLEIPVPTEVAGLSFRSWIADGAADDRREAFSEARFAHAAPSRLMHASARNSPCGTAVSLPCCVSTAAASSCTTGGTTHSRPSTC